MRALKAVILPLLLLLAACTRGQMPDAPPAPEGAVRLATFNVAYIRPNAHMDRWLARRGALGDAVTALDADIVAFQEMESFTGGHRSDANLQRDYLLQRFPEYEAAATGDPAEFPSTQPIFYRRDRFTVLDQGWLFFSETPEAIYSTSSGWGVFPSFAVWARFEDRRTGARFTVFNAHLPNSPGRANRRAAGLLADRVRARIAAGERVAAVGDFNAPVFFRAIGVLEGAGLELTRARGPTFHFKRGLNVMPGAIDHVFLGPGWSRAGDPFVLRGTGADGAWPSDHYPVGQDVRLDPVAGDQP